MYDRDLVLSILVQIEEALRKISEPSERFKNADEFTSSSSGMEALDSICMLFIAVGEAVKNIDKNTESTLLSQYPNVDWKGVMGFRDIIAHQYFDIDADQVFWICKHELGSLTLAIQKMIAQLNN
jgi:uncharacterized protein with HEPN domain